MAQDRSGRESSTRIVVIVLACLGGGILACAGIVVVFFAITAMGTSVNSPYEGGGVPIRVRQETEQAASSFLRDLCAGNTQAAWEQTSTGFQNRHEEQSKFFDDFLKQNTGLRDPATIEVKMQYADIGQATVPATVTPKSGGKIFLLLRLKRETEVWKLSDLAVTEEPKENEVIHVQASEPPEGWYRYVSVDKKFTLGFPSKPGEQKKQQRLGQGETTVYLVGVPRTRATDAGYVLNYYDLDDEKTDIQAKAYLEGAEKGAISASKGKIISSKSIELKGFPGRDFSIEVSEEFFMRTRVYLVERRVINMSYTGGTKNSLQSREARSFFDSLKLSE